MLKLPFVFIALEPAKDWTMNTERGEQSGTSYKVNVLLDEKLVVAKATKDAHKALEGQKRGADLVVVSNLSHLLTHQVFLLKVC